MIFVTLDEILAELRLAADPERVASLKRVGAASPALGVGLRTLRSLAKRIGHDHRLALALWQTPVREARILALLIDELDPVTATQMIPGRTPSTTGRSVTRSARTCLRIPRSHSKRRSNGRDDPKSS
jgi:hypothetical protein